jgi:hypothetical protein
VNDVFGSMRILYIFGYFEVLVNPNLGFMKMVEKYKFATWRKISKFFIKNVKPTQGVEQNCKALLEGRIGLFEERILLLFDIVGDISEAGTHFQFLDVGAIVNTHDVAVVYPSEHVDLLLVLDISDVP